MESQSSISLLSKIPISVDFDAQQHGQGSISEGFKEKPAFASSKEWGSKSAKHGALGFLPTFAVLAMTLGRADPWCPLGQAVPTSSRRTWSHGGNQSRLFYYERGTINRDKPVRSPPHADIVSVGCMGYFFALWAHHRSSQLLKAASTPLVQRNDPDFLECSEKHWPSRSWCGFSLGSLDSSTSGFTSQARLLSSGTHMFGVTFNTSLCADLSAKYPKDAAFDPPGFPCLTADQQGMTVNCTAAGYPDLPYVFSQKDGFKVTNTSQVKNRIFGIVNGKMMGREIGSFEVTTAVTNNPTTMAIQLRWDPPQQGMSPDKETHSPGAINSTELAIDTHPHPTLYASCSVSYLDAVVRWDGSNGSWSLLNTNLASRQLTATLWLPVVWQFATEQLASNLMNVARTRPKEEVMAVLNQQLARLAVGSAAGFFEPAAATDVSYFVQTMLGKYPVGPILALLALLLLYAILALTIFFVSLRENDEAIVAPPYDPFGGNIHVGEPSSLTLAQRWLVTPLPLVGFAFPREMDEILKGRV
ncbi:hypothetical protein M407DRAFT_219070 [Tulasnella calospora MUT 4182]|uniref:Uncharacterized protein n=1 Tax=Tulasnella calospora MUT 4182 TaxID=1051891 RepID=A0A0C3QAI8_9AGAM|nr:hypothetical protein M407DRAFT_219070 [Tulasnella calospora MUT 4182]